MQERKPLICDFCTSPHIVREYKCRDFDPVMPFGYTSLGDWEACAECAALIDTCQWEALAERALAKDKDNATMPPSRKRIIKFLLVKLYRDFDAHRIDKDKN